MNAAVLAALTWAPPAPGNVRIAGAVQPSTRLAWDPVGDPNLAGYRIYFGPDDEWDVGEDEAPRA